MHKANISTQSFSCNFFVETKLGSNLEFVLSDSQDAFFEKNGCYPHKSPITGNDGVSYEELLWDMLKKVFSKSKTIEVPELQSYGHVSFVVRAGSLKDLENALVRCDKIVGRWINKYRINHMRSR